MIHSCAANLLIGIFYKGDVGNKVKMHLWQPLNLTEACPANINVTACTSFGHIYLNLLVRLYGDSEDRRIQDQIYDKEEKDGTAKSVQDCPKQFDDEIYDFIVVGAGAAGCIVANRLTENGRWKVLLLEAGIEQPDVTLVPALCVNLLGSNIDWGYRTEPDGRTCLASPEGRCNWSRGKVMGGSTSVNGMVYVRGNKKDYDGWADMGNPGWSYDEVLPYFKKSEKNLNIEELDSKYHGDSGEQPVSLLPYQDDSTKMMVDAFHETGLSIGDYNGENQIVTMNSQSFASHGQRVSINNAFIQPIRYKRKNLVVKTESEVFKVLISERKVAYGVKYKRNGTIYTAYAKKEVILSAGPINTPKLLMLSGVGPKKHLVKLNITVKQNLPVGENLQDHVTFDGIVIVLNKSSTLVDQKTILDDVREYKKMKTKQGPLSGNGPIDFYAFFNSNANSTYPNFQIALQPILCQDYFKMIKNNISIFIYPSSYYDCITLRVMLLWPESRGSILLNKSYPDGPPLIYAKYLDVSSDLRVLLKGYQHILKLENTEAFKSRGAYFLKTSLEPCTQFKFGTNEYFECMAYAHTSTSYHPVGTCRMGPKGDKSVVVDPKLRVYGIFGLRVIDSSIMPRIISGNTQAPSMMIGEKGVDIVKRYWKSLRR